MNDDMIKIVVEEISRNAKQELNESLIYESGLNTTMKNNFLY